MKTTSPHDPRNDALDELIATALHGELTPEEQAQFETRLSNDPAARAAYQEAQLMHTMLENTYAAAQPDPAFEQRMVSGFRRRIQDQQHETAWESLLVLWNGVKSMFTRKHRSMPMIGSAIALVTIVLVLAGVAFGPITNGIRQSRRAGIADNGISSPVSTLGDLPLVGRLFQSKVGDDKSKQLADVNGKALYDSAYYGGITHSQSQAPALADAQKEVDGAQTASTPPPPADAPAMPEAQAALQTADADAASQPAGSASAAQSQQMAQDAMQGQKKAEVMRNLNDKLSRITELSATQRKVNDDLGTSSYNEPDVTTTPQGGTVRGQGFEPPVVTKSGEQSAVEAVRVFPYHGTPALTDNSGSSWDDNWVSPKTPSAPGKPAPGGGTTTGAGIPGAAAVTTPPAPDARKLIRNAQLELEVKSFSTAMDQIGAMTKAAGGYIDTSNSQKGGNGKLQGIVVVKVLPQYLDDYLLKLRDVGQVRNQSVKTDDVTKDYFDTQARLDNSRRMEAQLQDLLKHENSKVSDLLQVERELGRVRGDIEQMQGQLKLYDFQVAYATVTIQLIEKDLNQTAAYLLKEQDNFSLFATDVEATFQKARAAADDFKAQVLVANLVHNSGSDVSAELVVMVAPDQIESFLEQVRGLGRVSNFTRQTQRVAKDGGDSDQPADQALTEKDKVQVHVSIRSDDETRKQVALTVVTPAVDKALEDAKGAALANAGVEILNSSLNKTPEGQSTAQLGIRVPGKEYPALIASFRALGRAASFSIQRNDNSGPGANGDDAPVIITLALTDSDTPVQQTSMSVLASDVDAQAQQIKKDAAAAGVEVKASGFERQPDGTELAQMTFGLPMSKYAAFVESLKKLGKVESLTVRRQDRPDQTRADDSAPVEISLNLHNQHDVIADDHGLWATLRDTFGEGAGALFGSIKTIGVFLAFLAPWIVTLIILAWIARRIYLWRKK